MTLPSKGCGSCTLSNYDFAFKSCASCTLIVALPSKAVVHVNCLILNVTLPFKAVVHVHCLTVTLSPQVLKLEDGVHR